MAPPRKNPPEQGREQGTGLTLAAACRQCREGSGLRAGGRKRSWRGARSPTGNAAGLGTGFEQQSLRATAAPAAGPAQDGHPGVTQLVGCSGQKGLTPLGVGKAFIQWRNSPCGKLGTHRPLTRTQRLGRSIIPRALFSHRTCGFLPFHTAPFTYLCPG